MSAILRTWAWLTRCHCRHHDYLEHRSRTLHVTRRETRDTP